MKAHGVLLFMSLLVINCNAQANQSESECGLTAMYSDTHNELYITPAIYQKSKSQDKKSYAASSNDDLSSAITQLKKEVSDGNCVYNKNQICKIQPTVGDQDRHQMQIQIDGRSIPLKGFHLNQVQTEINYKTIYEPKYSIEVLRLLKANNLCQIDVPQKIETRFSGFNQSAAIFINGVQASIYYQPDEARKMYTELVELTGYESSISNINSRSDSSASGSH